MSSRALRSIPRVNYARLDGGVLVGTDGAVNGIDDELAEVVVQEPIEDRANDGELPVDVEALRRSVDEARQERDRLLQNEEIKRLQGELESLTLENAALQTTSRTSRSSGQVQHVSHPVSVSRGTDPFTVRSIHQDRSLRDRADRELQRFGLLSDSDSDTERAAPRPQSGRRGKIRSGKTAKLTSLVTHPQLWPHSHLSLSYVSKHIEYDSLSLAEFSAGYATILSLRSIEANERTARLNHFTTLMYLASQFPWPSVREFHGAILFEIECGRQKWGDSFQHIESRILHRSRVERVTQSTGPPATSSTVYFCAQFQHGKCSETSAHYGTVFGSQRKWVLHICAKCWLQSRVQENHSESSPECPLRSSSSSLVPPSSSSGGS